MKLGKRSANNRHIEAMATVTACHYEFGAGQALAFGVPRSKQFQITFNYWADGALHTGEFASAKAVPQGTLFPITYNREAPHENSKTHGAKAPRWSVLIAAGVVVLLAAASALAHGCMSG